MKVISTFVLAATLLLAADDAASCQRKFDEIKAGRGKPGATYSFTQREINTWAQRELPKEVPQGMRNPAVTFGYNQATGNAVVDFLRMQHAKGTKPGWLIEKLIEGERPIRVGIGFESANGYGTVKLQSVEISGVKASGGVLDFLIRHFFRPLYPEAHIDEKFEMGYNIDRVEIRPDKALVFLKKIFAK